MIQNTIVIFMILAAITGINAAVTFDHLANKVSTSQNVFSQTPTINSTTCHDVTTCDGNGMCYPKPVDGHMCKCSNSYATHECDEGTECCYKRKSQLTAFMLQLFLGLVGAGDFYLENISWGLASIGLTTGGFCGACIVPLIVSCCICPVLKKCGCSCAADDEDGEGTQSLIYFLYCCCAVAVFGIDLYRIIQIGRGEVTDGNGVNMASW